MRTVLASMVATALAVSLLPARAGEGVVKQGDQEFAYSTREVGEATRGVGLSREKLLDMVEKAAPVEPAVKVPPPPPEKRDQR
jgi:hypothetical protein